MTIGKMIRCFMFLAFLFTVFESGAQEKYFIYVQSDRGEPFYAKIDNALYSSTASGYVIIPKLAAGDYTVKIGFPREQYPEEEFRVSIAGNNEGFLLKHLDGNWVLFNTESMALIAGGKPLQENQVPVEMPVEPLQTDPFSSLLAGVVQDSSIMRSQPVKASQPSTPAAPATAPQAVIAGAPGEAGITVAQPDTREAGQALKENNAVAEPVTAATEPATAEPAAPPTSAGQMRRILYVNEEGGKEMIYVDLKTNDTIRLFMPVTSHAMAATDKQDRPKVLYEPPGQHGDLTIKPETQAQPAVEQKAEVAEQKGAQILYTPEEEVQHEKTVDENEAVRTVIPKTDCKAMATEKDFLRLRRRLAGAKESRRMVEVARRDFRSRCYTTEQVRNLSYLFLNDEGRYHFFDAVYPYTADPERFATLEAQLHDPYFLNRFKAMIQR